MSTMDLVATCALGLEEFLEAELRELGMLSIESRRAAVAFRGDWPDVWRTNYRLRTANRVLLRLGTWNGHDGDALAAGARNLVRRRGRSWGGVDAGTLFRPHQTVSLRATSSASKLRDVRWIALRVKDGLVDGQRDRYGSRSDIARDDPDLSLRVWLHKNQATLLLDTSGAPLDRRGYRLETVAAPLRETLAAAAVLAAGWNGEGPVVDPMCGSGTLLAEAAAIALGTPPGRSRQRWPFQRLPSFDPGPFAALRQEPLEAPGRKLALFGIDREPAAIAAAHSNLERAGCLSSAALEIGDGYRFEPPAGPGLVLVNPAYGERLAEGRDQWRRLGDLLKNRYRGWRAVVVAGGESLGKTIGLRPKRRIPIRNGPLEARVLVFDLY